MIPTSTGRPPRAAFRMLKGTGENIMAIEKVKELLKAVKTDPEAQAKLSGLAKPEDEDGAIRYYAEAAKLLGFDVTEKDIREMAAALAKEQKNKTEAAAGRVEALPDDELEKTAGGDYCYNNITYCGNPSMACYPPSTPTPSKPVCSNTFQQRENCWFNDGCDMIINVYSTYECANDFRGHI